MRGSRVPTLAEPACTQISSRWVEEAARLSLAFAMVREDSAIDLSLLKKIKAARPRMAMVASGGCTAALLASAGEMEKITLVDPNPAQLALTELKMQLLQIERGRRLAILGHRAMPPEKRLEAIKNLLRRSDYPLQMLGPEAMLAQRGPDFCGRYECVFAALRANLSPCRQQLQELLSLSDTIKQTAMTAPLTPLGMALDEAFESVMSEDNLIKLFGTAATANTEEPFARHFLRRLRLCLATLPAASNPYLQSLLLGQIPPQSTGTGQIPWLLQNHRSDAGKTELQYVNGTMGQALARIKRNSLHLVHLSNILDWLTAQEAIETLAQAARVLEPGGLVVIRRLNSRLDIQALAPDFRWLPEARELHRTDRSFFYKGFYLGQRL